jgi:hypothetical protein
MLHDVRKRIVTVSAAAVASGVAGSSVLAVVARLCVLVSVRLRVRVLCERGVVRLCVLGLCLH